MSKQKPEAHSKVNLTKPHLHGGFASQNTAHGDLRLLERGEERVYFGLGWRCKS